jgi:hypothetical protein
MRMKRLTRPPGFGVLASRGGYLARLPRDHTAAGVSRAAARRDGVDSRVLRDGWLESSHKHPQATVGQSARNCQAASRCHLPEEAPTCHSSLRSLKR